MFKSTRAGKGLRRSSGGSRTARVSSTQMGHGRTLADEQHRRPAFMPASPAEQGFDSDGPRLGGLEKRLGGGDH